jgi:uncharacterized protein with NRDE domain
MCTLTLDRGGGGFRVRFNRDEKRTRAVGRPPRRLRLEDRTVLAPLDPDGGGAWIGVNDAGLAAAILNRHHLETLVAEGGSMRSRGLLLLDALVEAGARQALERLREVPLHPYRPFELVLIDRSSPPWRAAWDGEHRELERVRDEDLPLVSSGYDPSGVRRARRALYRRMLGEGHRGEALTAFHRSHAPRRGPYSPCMHRSDAATVSFTDLLVGPGEALMRYEEGPPCRPSARHEARLELGRC